MNHLLTVVICTHNRSSLLLKTLDSLNAVQRPQGFEVKILVVANACTDDTREKVEAYQERERDGFPIEYCEEDQVGKSYALNRAIKQVREGYMLFVDDDHRVDVGYLEAVAEGVRRYPAIGIFCGRIIPDWTGREPSWVHEQGRYRIYPLPVPHFELGAEEHFLDEKSKIPGGGNLVIHADVFRRVGGFSTDLGPKGHDLAGSEDSDFLLRCMRQGETICYLPSMLQYHHVDLDRLKLAYIVRKSYQRSRTLVRARAEPGQGVPRYLWKKVIVYGAKALFSVRMQRRRFYLVRTAAAMGEISGFKQNQSA